MFIEWQGVGALRGPHSPSDPNLNQNLDEVNDFHHYEDEALVPISSTGADKVSSYAEVRTRITLTNQMKCLTLTLTLT